MTLKIIAEYKLYRNGKLIDSDKKEIIIEDKESAKDISADLSKE